MWDLIPSKVKRKYQMIECLFMAGKPLTISELAGHTGSSLRIIKYDLEELREELQKINGTVHTSKDGVQLLLPPGIGLDYFQHGVYDQSLGLSFLEKIFFDEMLGSEEMMAELYISSSLHRLVQTLEVALEKYGLTLLSNPYRISGHEMLIRNFYTAYFTERYTLDDWPFKNVNRRFLKTLIQIGYNYFETPEAVRDHHLNHFMTGVDLCRGMNGHASPNAYEVTSEWRDIQYELFLQLVGDTPKIFAIPDTDLRVYFNELIDWELFMSVPYLFERMESNLTLRQNIQEIQEAIIHLSNVFELPLTNNYYMVMQLNTAIDTYGLFPAGKIGKKYVLFPGVIYSVNHTLQSSVPLFYEYAGTVLQKICENRNVVLVDDDLDYLLSILLTRWPDLAESFLAKFYGGRILVASHKNVQHGKLIANWLRMEMSQYFTIEVFHGDTINEEMVRWHQFDLLVTTKSLALDIPQPILYISEEIRQVRVDMLRKMFTDISENRRTKYLQEVQTRIQMYGKKRSSASQGANPAETSALRNKN